MDPKEEDSSSKTQITETPSEPRGIPTTNTTPESNPDKEHFSEANNEKDVAMGNANATSATDAVTTKETQTTKETDTRPQQDTTTTTQPKDSSGGGNDQVSVDQPKQPLVASVTTSVGDQRKPPPVTAPETMVPQTSTKVASVVTTGIPSVASLPPTVEPTTNQPPPPPIEMTTAEDEILRQEREPLTSLYGQFISPTDTRLHDARQRLQTALNQTHALRVAFTERVYGKYRVCLKPPQLLVEQIRSDPTRMYPKLQNEIAQIKQEKEMEKRAAQRLNASTEQLLPDGLVDHAEQLMFVSAGLNLVILPEQTNVGDLKDYPERGPIHPETGQRVKSISQAAATAGSVILERTRKAAALRVERKRQRQLQLLSGEEDKLLSSSAATTSALFKAASTTSKHTLRPAKGPRSRTTPTAASTSLSASTLLSLNPQVDDLNNTVKSAATAALFARGVSGSHRTTQQRLRHPHPESLGGRRRANNMTAAKKEVLSQHPPLANLALTLPPLPATKERMERKPLPIVVDNHHKVTERATKAVQSILEPFAELQSMTKIRLLHNLSKFTEPSSSTVESPDNAAETEQTPSGDDPIDPVIAFSVLHAVGLIGPQQSNQKSFQMPESKAAPLSDKLQSLREHLFGENQQQTLTQSFLFKAETRNKRQRVEEAEATNESEANEQEEENEERPSKRQRVETPDAASNAEAAEKVDTPMPPAEDPSQPEMSDSLTVEIIRGGGEVLLDSTDASQEKTSVEKSSDGEKGKSNEESSSKDKIAKPKRRRSYSESSGQAASAASDGRNTAPQNAEGSLAYLNSSMPGSSASQSVPGYIPPGRYHQNATLNALHLAQQLRHGTVHHPAGDIVLGGMHQQQRGYDLSSFIPNTAGMNATQSQLAALGQLRQNQGLVGYAMEDREAAARALYAREQQTAALLRGATASYPPPAAAPFAHAGTHSAAMSALLGTSASGGLLGRSQYGGQVPTSLSQSLYQSVTSAASDGKDNSEQKESEGMEKPQKEAKKATLSVKPASQPKELKKSDPDRDQLPSTDSAPADASAKSEPHRDKPAESKETASEAAQGKEDRFDSQENAQEENQISQTDERGMKFFAPKRPGSVPDEKASLVRSGRFNDAIAASSDTATRAAVLEYLVSVGAAVPIPKALVLAPLKERLNTPGFRNSGSGGAPSIPRDIVVSAILVWLWASHEQNFQQAFEKSGRIDVDPDCKWLIQAAVDTSVRELTLEIADSMARGEGPFAEASAARKGPSGATKQGSASQGSEPDRSAVSKKVEIHTASVVSRALMTEICIDAELNSVLHHYQPLVEYLDEARLCALRAKSQERVLLATLLARRATMAESFSHAYVSAMVRAGEALGHGKLFEAVQNEDVMTSTMIPYDIFTDDTDAWEDPCKPDDGFTAGLSADDLVRRAHARAMIQKSLRKLQDRHSIRGGASVYGPYTDPSRTDSSRNSSAGGAQDASSKFPPAPSPRPGLKRKLSAITEPPVQPGTGSAEAKSWNVYDPQHFSAPLEWEGEQTENLPYGLHSKGKRARSVSLALSARSGEPKSGKKARRSMSVSVPPLFGSTKDDGNSKIPRSSHEIDWADVAGIFQRVELPRKSPSARSSLHETATATAEDGTIFAPFCKKLDHELPSEDESDSEEDLSEEVVLARHQVVLDDMKEKLSAFLEARKRQQERRKNRYKGKS